MMNDWRVLAGCIAVMAGCVLGCGSRNQAENGTPQGDDHAHADHQAPESLDDAVAQIKEARDELAAAYASGNAGEADHAFHELDHLIADTRNLIDEANLDRYAGPDAKAACDALVAALEKVHPPHDANATLDSSVYDDAKADIDAAITDLETAVNKESETPAAE